MARSCPFACRNRKGGFTLVEVLAVIALVVVLVGLLIGVMSGVQRRAEVARAEGELAMLAQALEQYRAALGDYPWVERHAADGAGAEANGRRLYQALMGYRSPLGDRILRGGSLQVRDGGDPLAAAGPAGRRRFIDPAEVGVGSDGEFLPAGAAHDPGAGAPDFSQRTFLDPWGRPYVYLYRSEAAPDAWRNPGFVLYSLGPDGHAGTIGGAPPVTTDGRRPPGSPDAQAADNLYHAQN